ncbi:hypothetical protein F1880_006443 [Penicillium rolfsii]|nr:hypothetical protein F1880_006443 [Penicillium rolfsii]
MDDFMNPKYLKRELRWSPSAEDASTIIAEPTVTWRTDAIATSVGETWAAEAASSHEGLLESLGGGASASITPAWPETTTDRIPATPIATSSSSAVLESTTPLTTASFSRTASSTTSPETAMTPTDTVLSTMSAANQTTAPSASSGGGDSIKYKIPIAIFIALVGLLIILAVAFFFFFIRRRMRRRGTHPPYEMSGIKTPEVSTPTLIASTPTLVASKPKSVASLELAATNFYRLPVIDISSTSTHEFTLSSASARSDDDSRTELGIARALPIDQRHSATEYDQRECSRPVSVASHRVDSEPPSTGLASMGMRFENQSSDENDTVSIISGEDERTGRERDLDDMSSVSSFDDDHPPIETHGQAFR